MSGRGDATRRELLRLVEERGDAFISDSAEAAGLLADWLSAAEPDNAAYVRALVATTGATLRDAAAAGVLSEADRARLRQQALGAGCDGAAAKWAIDSWTATLDIEDESTASPTLPGHTTRESPAPPPHEPEVVRDDDVGRNPRRLAFVALLAVGLVAVAAWFIDGDDEQASDVNGPVDIESSIGATLRPEPEPSTPPAVTERDGSEVTFAISEPGGLIVERYWLLTESRFEARVCLQAREAYSDQFDEPVPPGLGVSFSALRFADLAPTAHSSAESVIMRFPLTMAAGDTLEIEYVAELDGSVEASRSAVATLQRDWEDVWRASRSLAGPIDYQTSPFVEAAGATAELPQCGADAGRPRSPSDDAERSTRASIGVKQLEA